MNWHQKLPEALVRMDRELEKPIALFPGTVASRPCTAATSSFYRHLKLGNYPADWTGDQSDHGRDYGKR
jgi:hypothetical protein